MKNFIYICTNVINAVVPAKKKFKVVCRDKTLDRLTLQRMAPHSERGFAFIGSCVAIQCYPQLAAKLINKTVVMFALLTEPVRAMFKLTSLDLHTERKQYSTSDRVRIIGNRLLVKTKAEKSFYHSFISSNLNWLGVMQGLKVVL